jgi:hypothetical protein
MRFEERELKPYAEPVSASDLKEGSVYFAVQYLDEGMLTPEMEALVFIGRNLEPADVDQLYFQDALSYREGIRYGLPTADRQAVFQQQPESEISHIFDYEHALDELMACALRRREKGLNTKPR